MSNWRILLVIAGLTILAGIYVVANPAAVANVIGSITPWLFIAIGALQLGWIALRGTRKFSEMLWPAVVGGLLVFVGVGLLTGSGGPISLTYLLALLLMGTGIAKITMSLAVRRSRYWPVILISGCVSVLLALVIFTNYPISALSLLGVILGLELIADGVAMGAHALHEKAVAAAVRAVRT